MSRPAPVTPSGHEEDPTSKRLREVLVPDRCAALVQELQEGVVALHDTYLSTSSANGDPPARNKEEQ
jgi:hypothetical protein